MKILGISGSLRRESHNRRLLLEAAELFPPGTELVLYDGLKTLPHYDEDDDRDDEVDPAVTALRDAIAGADAILIATPEYNSSVPGALKNAIDWASRPFPDNVLREKPSLVIGASTGLFGAVWAQAETRKVLKYAGAQVLDTELAVGLADSAFDEHDGLVDPELRARLGELLTELVQEVAEPAGQAA
jgi:chromate reductase